MQQKNDGRNLLWKYSGMATQFLVALGIGVFIGMFVDKKIGWKVPVLVWLLPLLILIVLFYKVLKDTSTKK